MSFAQATFQSAGTGTWNSAARWTLISGTDADGIPDSNDDIVLQSGNTITINANYSCNNLTFNGGGLSYSGNRTLTVGGNVSVTATSTVSGSSASQFLTITGNMNVNTGFSLTIPAITYSISGTTTLDGNLTIGGYGRTRTFGNININASGTLELTGAHTNNINGNFTNNGTFSATAYNQIFNLAGSLTNNGTFNSGDGQTYSFSGSSNSISGTNPITIFEAVFDSPANYTNTATLTITDGMSGTGSFTNGNGANLTLTNGGPFTVSTFDASATGNTITYTGYGSPTGFSGSYYNLVLNKSSGSLGFSGAPSILNDLTIQSGIFQVAAVTVTVGNDLILEGGEFTPDNASGITNIGGDFIIDGGQYDHNSGDVNVSGNVEMLSGEILFEGGSSSIDITGNFIYEAGTANLQGGDFVTNDFYVDTGAEIFINGVNLTISGEVELDGTMTFNNSSGTKSVSSILVNATGNWNVTQPTNFSVTGDITNNGTFTGSPTYGTSIYTLTSPSGSFNGTNPLSMRDVVINSPGNYTNNTNLTITQSLTGTGSFSNANGSVLELQGAGPFSVSTFNASAATNTVTYSGGGSPSLNSGSYYNLAVNKSSGTITIGSATSVGNNLTVTAGILAVGAATLTVTNNLLLQGGEFTPDNASGITNVGGNFNISGGEYDHNSGQVNVTGNLTQSAGTVAFSGASSTLSVSGTYNYTAGTTDFQQGNFSPNNLYIGTGGTVTINSAVLNVANQVQLDGTLTFNSGTGSKTVNSILVNATGNWNVTQDVSFTVSGNITNNGTFTGSPTYGTSTYTLTSTTGVISGSSAINMRGVAINSPASITNQGLLTVANTFTGSGTFINGASGTFTYTGNNSSGTNFTITNFNASTTGNTVVYAGTTNQRWRATSTANNDYYNVIVNMGTGGSTRLNLFNNVRVNGTLTITEGDPVLGNFNLELGSSATVSGGDADDWIRITGSGVVRKLYSGFGADLVLPIGDTDDYSPITSFVVHSATLGANPYVNFSITDAAHPNRSTNNLALGGNDDGVAAVDYITRYWTLSANDMANPSFTASYQYTDGDIVGTEANMIAALYGQPPGETFFDWKETGTVNATNNTATVSNGDYWGALYAMDNNMDRLPVELLSFAGQVTANSVLLKWSTASEVNNSYFSVERSTDGFNFKEIAIVEGAGTTNNLKNYSFEDRFPLNGRSYYRLKQVDFNGQSEYSEVVSVKVEPFESNINMTLFPNPAQSIETVNLRILNDNLESASAVIKVVNQMGMEVWSSKEIIYNGQLIKLPTIPRGTYLVHVHIGHKKLVGKLLIQ